MNEGNILNGEEAKKQVQLLFNYYDVDPEYVVEALKNSTEQHRLSLTKHVIRGRLTIESSGDGIKITQHLKRPLGGRNEISYKEPSALAFKASRREQDVETGMFAFMAVLGGVAADDFDDMHPVDRGVVKHLANIFLMQ